MWQWLRARKIEETDRGVISGFIFLKKNAYQGRIEKTTTDSNCCLHKETEEMED